MVAYSQAALTAPITSPVAAPAIRKYFERISVFDGMSKSLSDAIAASTVTDSDATAITSALNNILGDVGTLIRGSVEFPGGLYLIGSSLNINSYSKLKAIGKATLKPKASSSADPLLFNVASKANVEIDGFIFDGNRPNLTGFANLVTLYQSEFVFVRNNYFTNTRGIAAIFSGCTHSGVEKNQFKDCGTLNRTTLSSSDRKQTVAFSSGGFRNFADDNIFDGGGLDQISVGSETDIRVTRNKMRDCDAACIYAASSTGALISLNNVQTSTTGGNGIDTSDLKDATISDNHAMLCGAAGILVAGDAWNVKVKGNECKNNWKGGTSTHRGGITLSPTAGKTIKNLTMSDNICMDDQGVGAVTQRYAIGYIVAGTLSNISISENNDLHGYDSGGNPDDLSVFQNGASFPPVAYPNLFNLADQAIYTIGPDTIRGLFEAVQINNDYYGSFFQNYAGVAVLKIADPSTKWQTTDTGTDQAFYRDSADSIIKLKNKTGGTKTYMVRRAYKTGKGG